MSEHHIAENRAKAVRADAAMRLVGQRDCEDWNEKDQAELDAWLAESPAHRVAYLRLDAAWKRADRLAAMQPPDLHAPQTKTGKFGLRIAGGLAAIAVAAIVIFTFLSMPREQSYATNIGGHRTVALKDGSRIELNTDTALRIADGRERTVWIDKGEAYFEIRHDAAHPFVVVAGDSRVTDLGTKFSVRRDGEAVEVALTEGRARFDAIAGQVRGKSAELVPGDQLVATATSVSKMRADGADLMHQLSWRKGLLVFDNLALSDVAARFNRYNHRKLIVAGADVARLTIVGTFRTDGIERFAHIAHDILGLQITHEGNEIIISR
jgi:transmembrane sensor